MAKKEANLGKKTPLGVNNSSAGWFVPNSAPSVPPGVIYILGVLLIIAAVSIGYLGIYGPSVDKNDAAKSRLSQKKSELEEVKQQEVEYIEYRKENDRLEKRLADLKTKLPSTVNELNNFLASINQRARSSRVAKWTLYKQEGNIPKGEVDAIPIRMEFVASYEAALQFFWELASMGDGVKVNNREQLINIRDVQITREPSRKEDMTTMVKVISVAETYLYTGNTAANNTKKK